jgi:two-component system phosphate regulon sensor histidine kinase PhoR
VKLGLRSKLFFTSLGLILISVLVADAYLSGALDADLTRRVRDDLFVRLGLVEREASRSSAPLDDVRTWDALADDLGRRARARVTVIRRDGRVIGDSEVPPGALSALDDHARRPEVIAALSQGRGESTRYSVTVKRRMMYVATPFRRGGDVAGVARLAMPLTEVDEGIAGMRKILLWATGVAVLVAILLSSVAAAWTSRPLRMLTRTARRMAAGDLQSRTRAQGPDEVAELGRALDQLAANLSRTLAELRSERDLLGRILEAMREGVLVLDAGGRVVLVNGALREMLLLGADVVGRTPLEVARNAELQEVLEEGRSSRQPVWAEIEVGGLKPRRLLVHTAALAGEPAGQVAVFVDVTELRRLESLRRDFVANVSHELRTPVATLRSAAETLRGIPPGDTATVRRFMEIIERNAERLHQLVEDLLDLSRIESREIHLDLAPLELGPVVAHAASLFQERAQARGIRLDSALPADLPRVRADRRAVEQILANLIDNALKYCREGAEVRIRADASPTQVRVRVEDTGPGIEARHLPRVFERFYRVDAGRSREEGGTGLGLSIVKHLVEAMGGTVAVESEPGRGSIFSFTLQRAAATEAA